VIQQQHTISRVRHILSLSTSAPGSHIDPSADAAHTLQPIRLRMEDISPRTSGKQFESFLRAVARCDSLLDARRLKNDISSEIRKTRVLLGAYSHGLCSIQLTCVQLRVKTRKTWSADTSRSSSSSTSTGCTLPTVQSRNAYPACPASRTCQQFQRAPLRRLHHLRSTPVRCLLCAPFLRRRKV
jgi:sorting nexin-25